MKYLPILTTFITIIKLNVCAQSTVFNTPLPNCTVGQDTVIFQSDFQNNNGGFKSIGINNGPPSTEFEWGFLQPLAAGNNCDNACGAPIATVPVASNGLTRM